LGPKVFQYTITTQKLSLNKNGSGGHFVSTIGANK
jgi:hypothetical protein